MATKFIPKTATGNVLTRILIVTHGGFIGEFLNVIRKYQGKGPVYNNSAKNCAMYTLTLQRNAKGGLKPVITLENDNSHLQLTLPSI